MLRAVMNRCAVLALAGLLAGGLGLSAARAGDPSQADIDALKKALEKYQDYKVAVRDLYLSTVGCVHYEGMKMEGHMDYAKGGMGIHFVNVPSIGKPLDPMKPNVLIYEPVGKELKLVAAEWLAPLTPDTKEKPTILGQPLQGPMEGHEPLIPQGFHHYDIHVWLFKDNPLGMFAPTNPDVTCDGSDFALLEMGTKMVDGP